MVGSDSSVRRDLAGRRRGPRAMALALITALVLPIGPADAQAPPPAPPPAPEAASGWHAKPGWTFQRQAVAAAHPAAAEAGVKMLRLGGSAVDAAVAAQLVLGLVEPQSSGLGGGAFLMLWDGQRVLALDGRETAPAQAREDQFLRPDGRPLPFDEAVQSGLSVGVPGVLRLLELAHRRHGKLLWKQLFQPAIQLATEGFEVGPRLQRLSGADAGLRRQPRAAAYLLDAQGRPWPAGHKLRNPAYAAVLARMAEYGADAFYRGPVAEDMVAQVRGHAQRPGRLSLQDLADYRVREREPLCHDWRAWRLCGFPPPGSGALAVAQMLGMLEAMPPPGASKEDGRDAQGLPGPEFLHRYAEVARLAYADRALYLADPDFVPAPAGDWRSLIAPAYLKQRAALVGPRAMGAAMAGQPEPVASPVVPVPPGSSGSARLPTMSQPSVAMAFAPQPDQPEHGTSHLSVVDAQGMALAMTTTVEAQFGSRLLSDGGTGLAGGFFLNNQLTDFSLQPRDAQGLPVANRLEPGKRPRSAMSPTLVFSRADGRLLMSLGSPGGAAIPHFVAKTLIATLAWELDPQAALDLPNFGNFNGPTVLEAGRFPAQTVQALRERGHRVLEIDLTSGGQVLRWVPGDGGAPGHWRAGADPRREGEARGD